jgi:hypothetical protein
MISCCPAFLPECSEALQTFRYSIRVLCTLPTVGRRSIKCQFVFMFQPQREGPPTCCTQGSPLMLPTRLHPHTLYFTSFTFRHSRSKAGAVHRMSSPSRAQSKRANLLKLLSDIESLEANLKVSLPRTFLPLLPPKPFTFIHDYICRFSQ